MTKTSRKKIASAPTGELDPLLVPIARAFEKDRDVTVGKMFGSKLPKPQVDQLVESGDGERFDPGHGKVMKEWVSVPAGKRSLLDLAREAHRFVRGGAR
jgi:hypothetical protein